MFKMQVPIREDQNAQGKPMHGRENPATRRHER